MNTLKIGDKGSDVSQLQQKLKAQGFDPGTIDGDFGPATEAAVMAFQHSHQLLADGIAGPKTLAALGLTPAAGADGATNSNSVIPQVTVAVVSKMFPATPIGHINTHLPAVLDALKAAQLTDKSMVLMALATIRAETESFEPISEFKSRFNTSPHGHPFDLYDNRKDLGNQGPPDGESFRGRGFVQLTGRSNYDRHGHAIGLKDQLVQNPQLANDPKIASQLLADFLRSKEIKIKTALLSNDLKTARRLVNGGSNGLDRFKSAFHIGDGLIS